MQAPLEHIRLSSAARDELIKLKRTVGIENWNVYCRWAFCISIADNSRPPIRRMPADSNVELTWKVFAGQYEAAYVALLIQRCYKDRIPLTQQNLAQQLRMHIHRGIFSTQLKALLSV